MMQFLDATGVKLFAQKIIETAGSGASNSNYKLSGANQYITAEKNNSGNLTGILYSWIPTIDSQPTDEDHACGLMSRTSYNQLGKLSCSWNLIYYQESGETNRGLEPIGCPVNISFVDSSSQECSVRVYIQSLGGGSDGYEYGKIIAEVSPYTKSKVTITYNEKVAREATKQNPYKAVAYVDYVKGAKMTINVVKSA